MEIKTHQDFFKKLYELGDEFVLAEEQLAEKLKNYAWANKANGWVNFDVQSFLHAIARYIEDIAQLTEENAVFPQNVIKNIDDIDWQRFYQFILAGKGYE